MSTEPSVAVIVVNYNSAEFIDAFCASLREVEYANWRLVVVDSASSDGSLERIQHAFPAAIVVRCDENGRTTLRARLIVGFT